MNNIDKPILIRLVHMGDSITYGQFMDESFRWTSIVADHLLRKYLDTSVNILSINRGISGETTRKGLERFGTDVQSMSPHIMTLQFGLNDCNCWLTDGGAPRVSPLAFRANLIEMIGRARRFGAKRIILSNNHPTVRYKVMLNGERYEDANARYSEIVREVAAETQVVFCDIRKGFGKFTARELEAQLLPYPDQLHLSMAGNMMYADLIMPIIEKLVQETELELKGEIDHEK